jgi:hypothetical protein
MLIYNALKCQTPLSHRHSSAGKNSYFVFVHVTTQGMRVKAHDCNYGSELADHLAREAACSGEADIAYIKIPKSAVINDLKEKSCTSVAKRINRNFLAYYKRQNTKRLQMCINLSMTVTGHGTRRHTFIDSRLQTIQNAFVEGVHKSLTIHCGNVNC